MNSQEWYYLLNQFLNASKDNFKLFLSMTFFHYNILLGLKDTDPDIKEMFNDSEPFHNKYRNAFTQWQGLQASQLSTTAAFEHLVEGVQSKLARHWDNEVQKVYDVDSDEYKAILPHHRKPFMTGGQDERIAAVATFQRQLEIYPLLASLAAEVKGVYNQLIGSDAVHDANIEATGTGSTDLEAARVEAAWAMFGNLGFAMRKYKSQSDKIERLFPVKLIRDKEQVDFLGHVPKETALDIVRRGSLKPDAMITKKNKGTGALKFFAAAKPDQKTAANMFTVLPGDTLKTAVAEFGLTKETPFINVLNESNLVEGEYELVLG